MAEGPGVGGMACTEEDRKWRTEWSTGVEVDQRVGAHISVSPTFSIR